VNNVTIAVVPDGMDLTDKQWAVLEPTFRPRASASPYEPHLVRATLDARFLRELPPRLIGDRGYDSDPLDHLLHTRYGIEMIAANKTSRRVRTQDGRPLRRARRRWKVERFFAWLHNFRRVVTRWEHHAENYLGMVQLACAGILLRHL
jgi:transposase